MTRTLACVSLKRGGRRNGISIGTFAVSRLTKCVLLRSVVRPPLSLTSRIIPSVLPLDVEQWRKAGINFALILISFPEGHTHKLLSGAFLSWGLDRGPFQEVELEGESNWNCVSWRGQGRKQKTISVQCEPKVSTSGRRWECAGGGVAVGVGGQRTCENKAGTIRRRTWPSQHSHCTAPSLQLQKDCVRGNSVERTTTHTYTHAPGRKRTKMKKGKNKLAWRVLPQHYQVLGANVSYTWGFFRAHTQSHLLQSAELRGFLRGRGAPNIIHRAAYTLQWLLRKFIMWCKGIHTHNRDKIARHILHSRVRARRYSLFTHVGVVFFFQRKKPCWKPLKRGLPSSPFLLLSQQLRSFPN